MDCYIVRIYRRDENDSRNIVGLVETIGIEERRAFKGTDELITILEDVKTLTKRKHERQSMTPV